MNTEAVRRRLRDAVLFFACRAAVALLHARLRVLQHLPDGHRTGMAALQDFHRDAGRFYAASLCAPTGRALCAAAGPCRPHGWPSRVGHCDHLVCGRIRRAFRFRHAALRPPLRMGRVRL